MGWSGMGVYRYQGGSSRHMRSAESISSPSARSSASSLVSLAWYRTLNERAIHAFWASAIGWALDAFDFQVFSFSLTAIAATFALSQAQAGLIATATLVVSAFGGVLAGVLADQIGRVRNPGRRNRQSRPARARAGRHPERMGRRVGPVRDRLHHRLQRRQSRAGLAHHVLARH